MDKDG